VLDGGVGVDTLTGGNGNDTYVVDAAGETIVESSALGGTDTVQSSVSFALGSNVENLTLTGAAAINGTGNALANSLLGNGAANTLDGGARRRHDCRAAAATTSTSSTKRAMPPSRSPPATAAIRSSPRSAGSSAPSSTI
jgi:hypothetical protein